MPLPSSSPHSAVQPMGRIPPCDLLSEAKAAEIEAEAETILAEIGINFTDHPEALARWQAVGAQVQGERVYLPRGLARKLCQTAPARFVQHAANPARDVEIGGARPVTAPVYGPPFVQDPVAGRRDARFGDFQLLMRLAQACDSVTHAGGTLCEPTDLPLETRHLDMLLAHATLSDKPFMGASTDPERARDSIAFAKILFGYEGTELPVLLSALINIGSPLSFDATMSRCLELYAQAGQATVISAYAIMGATAPVTVEGALAQALAEVMAGIAYAQLIRSGAPVIFGLYASALDLRTGASIFASPEVTQLTIAAGQLARRLGVPYRAGGCLTGAFQSDAHAGYEAAGSLWASQLAGVDFMLHGCGWLESGLATSAEKFVLDADQLSAMLRQYGGIAAPSGAALAALREVGPGGHYLGAQETLAEGQARLWKSEVVEDRPFDAWDHAGRPDTVWHAHQRVSALLQTYQPPALAPERRAALEAFVARRKAEIQRG
ncbi:trimethylamine methyltransferase family protein [Thioclava sp. GXIMD4216]|uniref:trimethylamine methyltransferase family protein n=1 Tax=Thioclava sp. GXIMD4216 TaxID=3131929 RepID=UPI0030D41338